MLVQEYDCHSSKKLAQNEEKRINNRNFELMDQFKTRKESPIAKPWLNVLLDLDSINCLVVGLLRTIIFYLEWSQDFAAFIRLWNHFIVVF